MSSSEQLPRSVASVANDLLASSDVALVVVTTASNEQRSGCVVGFHAQCGIDPIRYAVWLSKANFTYRVSLFASHFAVHFLRPEDGQLAHLFGAVSGDDVDKFDHCAWTTGPGDVPILTDCPNVLILKKSTQWDDSSDHVCLIGAVVDAHSARPAPLRLSAVDINAGHSAEERPTPNVIAT